MDYYANIKTINETRRSRHQASTDPPPEIPRRTHIPPPPTSVSTSEKGAKRHEREMEFVNENKDYNVVEFYEEFRDYLPKIVMVNQGFCGEIVEDTFDRGQLIRIQAISKQQRVIAKFQYARHSNLISIPVTYGEGFCIVKHGGKTGKPKQIYILLKENILPLTVQFPKDHIITVGNKAVNTNNIPSMELVQTFDEVYLLGNYITDGVMSQDVVHVPLYLSQLRLSVITGISGQSKQRWARYQEELEKSSAYIEYDQEFGNSNIAEYDPNAIHLDTTYSYVEPTTYSTFARLVQKSPLKSYNNTTYKLDSHHQDDVYEDIDNTTRQGQVSYAQLKTNTPAKEHAFKKKLETALQTERNMPGMPNVSSFKHKPNVGDKPPPVAPKPRFKYDAMETDLHTDTHILPTVPERKAIPQIPKTTLNVDSGQAPLYSNDVPRTSISPTMHKTEVCKQTKVEVSNIEEEKKTVREVKNSADVASLTIDDVGEYLKKLKLENYASKFKEQLIDGAMLVEIDREILKDEFGMRAVEALRLLKFAKDGHIPM